MVLVENDVLSPHDKLVLARLLDRFEEPVAPLLFLFVLPDPRLADADHRVAVLVRGFLFLDVCFEGARPGCFLVQVPEVLVAVNFDEHLLGPGLQQEVVSASAPGE